MTTHAVCVVQDRAHARSRHAFRTRRLGASGTTGGEGTGTGSGSLMRSSAARAFVELAEAPPEAIRTVNYTVLGPMPSPTAQELVDAIRARVAGAKLDFKVDPRVSAVVDAVGKGPYVDHYARTEWGWQHRFDLGGIIDSFTKKEKSS